VDGVDNKVTGSGEIGKKRDISGEKITPTGGGGDALAQNEPPRGSDLAREALRAAQASAKARGRGRPRGSGSSTVARRRRRWSGPRPDDRDPQLLGGLVSRMAADRGWTEKLNGGQVFSRWSALVGSDVAEHAEPISLTDGELTVQADSTAWATQLRLLQRQLLAKIAAGVGNGVVKRLKVAGPSAPSWRHGNRHVPGRGPRDTYG
jgi:predicted nucleic acid-binding Zn ribbon protein